MNLPGEPSREDPWYLEGLRFECRRCHACCKARGEYVFVYIEDQEVEPIARALGLSPRAFLKRFCTRHEGERVLRFEEELCPLHDGRGCRVHPVRPVQCRTWPFWPENLQSREAWEEKVGSFCPGAGRGRLWSFAEIVALAREMAENSGETWNP